MLGNKATCSRAAAAVPGTCGELFQGLVDGEPCLVSCPIDRWSSAAVRPDPSLEDWRVPAGRPKTRRALQLASERLGLEYGHVSLESDLPWSKGYGSSTADIGAALRAAMLLCGARWEPRQVAELAAAVEPSDSTLFAGLTRFDHRNGHRLEYLGEPPAMEVLVLDTRGTVDTLEFNRRDPRAVPAAHAQEQGEAFRVLASAIAQGDPVGIGWAAARSAEIQQRVLPKPGFGRLLPLAESLGAVGINVAHSGTLLGVLFAGRCRDRRSVVAALERAGLPLRIVGWQRMIGGGPRLSRRTEGSMAYA